ncbi:MAG: hypothetical protein J5744_06425 [Oscillospiraceae bacterium]|nr:hypothetical protein [Oscillospiraceae bacterium]
MRNWEVDMHRFRLPALIMVLVLCLSLCSCGPKDDPVPGGNDPEPPVDGPGSEKVLDTKLLQEFYGILKGVWVRTGGSSSGYSFLAVSKDGGDICFTAGIPESDFIFGGPIDYIEKSGNVYTFNVHVPEVPSTEEYSGHEAYDLNTSIDVTSIDAYEIKANDHARDSAMARFTFYCADLESLDWGALHAGNEPMPSLDTDLAAKLWNQLSGIWLLDEVDDSIFFTTFTVENGEYCIGQGIPASGYMLSGYITDIQEKDGQYEMILFVPAVDASEMDDGHPAYYTELYLAITGNGKLKFTCFAGDGDYSQWRFAANDWDTFDWNQIYGSDVSQAWNKLSGAWVGINESGKTLFADFYVTVSGDRRVSMGVPFTGPASEGTVVSFEDRTVDSTWWAQLELLDSGKSILIMIDYSAFASGKIRITDFFDDGKVFTLEYKAQDSQHLTEEMMP